MPKFVVTVKETWSAKVEVEAHNKSDALERVYNREVYPSTAYFEMESVDDPESWIVEKVETKPVPWGSPSSNLVDYSDYTEMLNHSCSECGSENTYPTHCDTDEFTGVPCVICDNCGYAALARRLG